MAKRVESAVHERLEVLNRSLHLVFLATDQPHYGLPWPFPEVQGQVIPVTVTAICSVDDSPLLLRLGTESLF
jgi:hypothetical protein